MRNYFIILLVFITANGIAQLSKNQSTNVENLKHLRTLNSSQDSIELDYSFDNNEAEKFIFSKVSNFSQALQAKYPQIITYRGVSKKNVNKIILLTSATDGYKSSLFENGKITASTYINTKNKSITNQPISNQTYGNIKCGTSQINLNSVNSSMLSTRSSSNQNLRIFRLAVAATSGYSNYHGGRTIDALQAINATIANVNEVYKRDLSIKFELVGNNDLILFTNPTTDPYGPLASDMLGQNETTLNQIIGINNYDIGHVFDNTNGGVAILGNACTSFKAQGVSGLGQPEGANFDIEIVAHELGHQLGATHTQNNQGCFPSATNSVEPGSGSTIMSYAGICHPNVQRHVDDYFHSNSIDQIDSYVINHASCNTTVAFNNSAPVVDAGSNNFIPKMTPFILNATASDLDNDDLTYNWEQMDAELAPMPPLSTNDVGPMFRSYPPTHNSSRTFPSINNLLNGTSNAWEVLPAKNRQLNFNVTVRDNNANNGLYATDKLTLTVIEDAGPFVVLDNLASNILYGGDQFTVNWDVAKTDVSPINTSHVNILMSADGGLTFPYQLSNNTPNDGNQKVLLPRQNLKDVRFKVEAANNVFFNISNISYEIQNISPGYDLLTSEDELVICQSNSEEIIISTTSFGGHRSPINISFSGLPNRITPSEATFVLNPNDVKTIRFVGAKFQPSGVFPIQINAISNGIQQTKTINITILDGTFPSIQNTHPAIKETNVDLKPRISWNPIPHAEEYLFIISNSDKLTFSNVHQIQYTNGSTFVDIIEPLEINTKYYWKAIPRNKCNRWDKTLIYNTFTTGANLCTKITKDVPIQISSAAKGSYYSAINVAESGTLREVSILDLSIEHNFVNDLSAELVTPTGKRTTIFNRLCGNNKNMNLSFDENADLSYQDIPCPPTNKGTYQPLESFNSILPEDVNGIWQLNIKDNVISDGGQLNSWTLQLCWDANSTSVRNSIQTDEKKIDLLIYPNPAKDNISMLFFGSEDEQITSIEIKDISGRTVMIPTISNFLHNFDVSGLNSGQYILKVMTNLNQYAEKFILN